MPRNLTPLAPARRRRATTRLTVAALATALVGGAVALTGPAALADPAAPPATPAAQPTPSTTTTPGVPTGSASVLNVLSGKCIDALDGAKTPGTPLQQWQCWPNSEAQIWDLQDAGDGLVRIVLKSAPTSVIGVADVADGAAVQLAEAGDGADQRWRPVATSEGIYEFHNAANDDLVISVADAKATNGARLVLGPAASSDAQRFRMVADVENDPWKTENPFGPNVTVIDRTWSQYATQRKVDAIFADQQTDQFGVRRDAVIFTPGAYTADVKVGFNTQILGAGLLPGDVTITGHVGANADWWDGIDDNQNNSTQNFWRGAENLTVKPTGGEEMWAVSQAAPYRRMQIDGDLILAQPNGQNARCGWASGGLLADSKITGTVDSCTQQQWYSRNSEVGAWESTNWNIFFQGVNGAPEAGEFDKTKYTVVDTTPVVREKPFVYLDGSEWKVFVPALHRDSTGTTWADGSPEGESLGLDAFYITQPGDTAKTINKQLKAGKSLIVTPGVYKLDRALEITKPNTVVLGLGLATLQATRGNAAIKVADVDGVKIAGLLVDAGAKNSDVLVEIGPKKSKRSHAENPTSVHDLFVRIGGNWEAHATQSVVVNSSDVIGDHLWVWRADHPHNAPDCFAPDWKNTTGRNGLVVNGDRVSMYGLFVEHFQQYQTLWNGEGGRTFFYQNETPYDAPKQKDWMDGKKNGWAVYKVSDKVKDHQATGLGSYAVFVGRDYEPNLWTAFEVPKKSGVVMRHMVTVAITGGTISSVINGEGPATPPGVKAVTVEEYSG